MGRLDFNFFLNRISRKLNLPKRDLMNKPIHLIEEKLNIDYDFRMSKRQSHPARFSKLYKPVGRDQRNQIRSTVNKLLSKV